ncbi:MAG: NFACT family protein [Clostridia bacterium]|nr:NFACT family protein [Clostridia bacterium]
MALDGILLHLLKNELRGFAVGSRVEKVHQPSREELVLQLRAKKEMKRLLLSVRSNSPRIHFTGHPPENPPVPPMFCMLMRKKLTGAVITDIRQLGLDRVIYIDFDAVNEIGDRTRLTLSIEIMAKCSNIILTDSEHRIVDAMRRLDLSRSPARQILPGFRYTPPPAQDKIDLLTEPPSAVIERMLGFPGKTASSALLCSVSGASPLTCRETAVNCGDTAVSNLDEEELRLIEQNVGTLSEVIKGNGGRPYMLYDENGTPADFSFLPVKQFGNKYRLEEKDSYSDLLDDFYFERDRAERTRQKSSDLTKLLANAIARTAKKVSLRQAELTRCADREKLRISAELISANLYRLEKGAPYYEIENYYDGGRIMRIKADPAKSPSANAQKYYKDYRKAKTAEQLLCGLIEEGQQDLQYLESVADALERAENRAEIDEIRNELTAAGYIKKHAKKTGGQTKLLPPIEYMTSDGFRVLVGRNNMQNDRLSLKTAAKTDMWLHTQKIHGSHVIIVGGSREISDEAIVEAAEIAAYHSKARDAKLVPVDYTLVKNLKKPQGAPPGKVIYHVYYSVNVTPDREKIEKMRVQ